MLVALLSLGTAAQAATISVADLSITEGNAGSTNATITLSLSQSSTQTITVNPATANGSAVAPSDYTATSTSVSFAPGVLTRTVSVPVIGDTLYENNETFTLNLSAAVNATISRATATATITNDDAAPSLSIADRTVTEGNTGTVSAAFTVTLSAPSGRAVTVSYGTANGSAVAPADYTATSGTLTIAVGQTTGTITVPVKGDTLNESNETFTLSLSSPTAATIARATAVGTITDNDPIPSLSVADLSLAEGNAGSANAVFTLTLSSASGQTVTVNAATADGSAVAPSDYSATSGPISFSPGATTRTVSVPVQGDTLYEGNETFTLSLSAAANATISRATATATITDDDAAPVVSVAGL